MSLIKVKHKAYTMLAYKNKLKTQFIVIGRHITYLIKTSKLIFNAFKKGLKMLIGDIKITEGHEIAIDKLNSGKYCITVDGRMTHRDLDADSTIRWLGDFFKKF